jgi:uncharacterized protein
MHFRATEDGIELSVRLTPRSAIDLIEGVTLDADGRQYLAARVRAVPEKGTANAALEKLIAKSLDTPKSAVGVVAGHTSRMKTVRVAGDPGNLSTRLTLLGQAQIGGAGKSR